MELREGFRAFARGPGRALYAALAPVLRRLCATPSGRRAVETVMRTGGRALLWAFDAHRQDDADGAAREWQRILRGIGLQPEADGNGCTVCFERCTLDLRPGDQRTCDTVMSINDEMLTQLGGRMVMGERLVDPGGQRCQVRVDDPTALAGERELWCDASVAQTHFDTAAPFYDWIMGWFEVPANRRAVSRWALPPNARVVELGVGTGLGLVTLLRSLPPGATVLAVDRSPAMLARAQARLKRAGLVERVTLLHADATRLPIPSGACDAVYSSFLLDLMDVAERRAVLAEARRVLRPRGDARFVVMDAAPERRRDRALTSIYNACYARWNPIWMALARGYAPHCRPVRLSELLEDSGFAVTGRGRAHVTAFPVAIYQVQAGGGP